MMFEELSKDGSGVVVRRVGYLCDWRSSLHKSDMDSQAAMDNYMVCFFVKTRLF